MALRYGEHCREDMLPTRACQNLPRMPRSLERSWAAFLHVPQDGGRRAGLQEDVQVHPGVCSLCVWPCRLGLLECGEDKGTFGGGSVQRWAEKAGLVSFLSCARTPAVSGADRPRSRLCCCRPLLSDLLFCTPSPRDRKFTQSRKLWGLKGVKY